jgi:hypothetical protein
MKILFFLLIPILLYGQVGFTSVAGGGDRIYNIEGGLADNLSIKTSSDRIYVASPFTTHTSFSASDATPDISACASYITANVNATTITTFDGAPASGNRILMLYIGDNKTTIRHTTGTLDCCAGGYNLTPKIGDVLTLTWDGSKWLCTFLLTATTGN